MAEVYACRSGHREKVNYPFTDPAFPANEVCPPSFVWVRESYLYVGEGVVSRAALAEAP